MATMTPALATEVPRGPSPLEHDPMPADPPPGEPANPGDPGVPDPVEDPSNPSASPALSDPSLPDSRFFSPAHFATVVAFLRRGARHTTNVAPTLS